MKRRMREKEKKYEDSFSKLCNKDHKPEDKFPISMNNFETSFLTGGFQFMLAFGSKYDLQLQVAIICLPPF